MRLGEEMARQSMTDLEQFSLAEDDYSDHRNSVKPVPAYRPKSGTRKKPSMSVPMTTDKILRTFFT